MHFLIMVQVLPLPGGGSNAVRPCWCIAGGGPGATVTVHSPYTFDGPTAVPHSPSTGTASPATSGSGGAVSPGAERVGRARLVRETYGL